MPARLILLPPREPHSSRPVEVLFDEESNSHSSNSWVLGRNSDADVVLCSKTPGRQTMISRKHATVSFDCDAGWRIQDHGSLNGLLLNGRRLGAAPEPLQSGDSIGLGQAYTIKCGECHQRTAKLEFFYSFEITNSKRQRLTKSSQKEPKGEEEARLAGTSSSSTDLARDGGLAYVLADKELLCSICRGLVAGACTLECQHMYCFSCITSWLASKPHNGCPDCRATVIAPPTHCSKIDKIAARVASQMFSCTEKAEWDAMVRLSKDAALAMKTQGSRDRSKAASDGARCKLGLQLGAAAAVANIAFGRPQTAAKKTENACDNQARVVVGYANSNSAQSTCVACDQSITTCSARVGLRTKHTTLGFLMTKWHHLNCFRPSVGADLSQVEGLAALQYKDRQTIEQLYRNVNTPI